MSVEDLENFVSVIIRGSNYNTQSCNIEKPKWWPENIKFNYPFVKYDSEGTEKWVKVLLFIVLRCFLKNNKKDKKRKILLDKNENRDKNFNSKNISPTKLLYDEIDLLQNERYQNYVPKNQQSQTVPNCTEAEKNKNILDPASKSPTVRLEKLNIDKILSPQKKNQTDENWQTCNNNKRTEKDLPSGTRIFEGPRELRSQASTPKSLPDKSARKEIEPLEGDEVRVNPQRVLRSSVSEANQEEVESVDICAILYSGKTRLIQKEDTSLGSGNLPKKRNTFDSRYDGTLRRFFKPITEGKSSLNLNKNRLSPQVQSSQGEPFTYSIVFGQKQPITSTPTSVENLDNSIQTVPPFKIKKVPTQPSEAKEDILIDLTSDNEDLEPKSIPDSNLENSTKRHSKFLQGDSRKSEINSSKPQTLCTSKETQQVPQESVSSGSQQEKKKKRENNEGVKISCSIFGKRLSAKPSKPELPTRLERDTKVLHGHTEGFPKPDKEVVLPHSKSSTSLLPSKPPNTRFSASKRRLSGNEVFSGDTESFPKLAVDIPNDRDRSNTSLLSSKRLKSKLAKPKCKKKTVPKTSDISKYLKKVRINASEETFNPVVVLTEICDTTGKSSSNRFAQRVKKENFFTYLNLKDKALTKNSKRFYPPQETSAVKPNLLKVPLTSELGQKLMKKKKQSFYISQGQKKIHLNNINKYCANTVFCGPRDSRRVGLRNVCKENYNENLLAENIAYGLGLTHTNPISRSLVDLHKLLDSDTTATEWDYNAARGQSKKVDLKPAPEEDKSSIPGPQVDLIDSEIVSSGSEISLPSKRKTLALKLDRRSAPEDRESISRTNLNPKPSLKGTKCSNLRPSVGLIDSENVPSESESEENVSSDSEFRSSSKLNTLSLKLNRKPVSEDRRPVLRFQLDKVKPKPSLEGDNSPVSRPSVDLVHSANFPTGSEVSISIRPKTSVKLDRGPAPEGRGSALRSHLNKLNSELSSKGDKTSISRPLVNLKHSANFPNGSELSISTKPKTLSLKLDRKSALKDPTLRNQPIKLKSKPSSVGNKSSRPSVDFITSANIPSDSEVSFLSKTNTPPLKLDRRSVAEVRKPIRNPVPHVVDLTLSDSDIDDLNNGVSSANPSGIVDKVSINGTLSKLPVVMLERCT